MWTVLVLSFSALVNSLGWAGEMPEDPEFAQLESALSAHPDDPDLIWAKAMALSKLGRPKEAAAAFEVFVARWPNRRPDGIFQLGRALHEAGRYEEALKVLARAVDEGSEPGPAHFYRGLALRALGRTREASGAFAVAHWYEPELKAQALLIEGLDSLARREDEQARRMLMEAASLDETGEIARVAKEALAKQPLRDTPRRLSLSAYAGFESDSNVTLESDQLPGSTTSEDDSKWLLGAGFRYQAFKTPEAGLALGYRFNRSEHEDLEGFDSVNHMPFMTATWRVKPRVSLQFDGLYVASLLNTERYSRSLTGQPSVLIELGPRAGVLRIHGELTRRGYIDEAVFSSLERSGLTMSGGLTQYFALPFGKDAFGALGGSFSKTRTGASTDLLGFRGDYDRERSSALARAIVPLPRDFKLTAAITVSREMYDNDNLVHSLTDEGVGTFDRMRRRDTIFDSRLGISFKPRKYIEMEFAWRYSQQISNVDTYDYERHVLGVYLKTEL